MENLVVIWSIRKINLIQRGFDQLENVKSQLISACFFAVIGWKKES